MEFGLNALMANLASGQSLVIDAEGNARIINPGEQPNAGELVLQTNSAAADERAVQATLIDDNGQGDDVTQDIQQIVSAIEEGQDPTQVSEETDPAAGSEDSSSGTVLDTVSRIGDETIAQTLFETRGLEGIGLSETQSLSLLEQFRFLFLPSTTLLSSNDDSNGGSGGNGGGAGGGSDTPPVSRDFSIQLNNEGFSSILFDDPSGIADQISDIEDDLSGDQVNIVITRLPDSGTLLYDGEPVTEDMLTLFDESGEPIGDVLSFDPTKFSYQNDDQSTGFILGVKEAPDGLDGDESVTSFLNWGEPTDDPNTRVLTFTDDEDNIVDQIFITTIGGVPTQYYADKNHIGYGLGVGGGDGIQQSESIIIDLSQRPAENVTLGLDGMGGWFEEGHSRETQVLIRVTLDDGTVIEQTVMKQTSGNQDLFREISIAVPDENEGAVITQVEVSTIGPGNWELRYLETDTPDDSFDYRAIDSDGNFSEESTVTIDDGANTPPVAIDDPMGFSVSYGTFNNDVWEFAAGEIEASYDGQTQNISGDGLKRGVSGDENGGPAAQIQYNREEGLSEQFTFNLEKPATSFSFTVSNLFKNEGGPGNHEQGKWVAYLGNNAVASGMFIANEGSNKGFYSFNEDDLGGVAFDRVVFEAVDFVIEPARGSDSSDYFLTGFEASGSGAYAANQGEVLAIPIEELLTNDFDPDSDHIRFTHITEANNADIYVENGIVYVALDDNFSGPTTFDYQITDDDGGFSEATVNIIVNPVQQPVLVESVSLVEDTVLEGEQLVFTVLLTDGVLSATEFDAYLGLPTDSAGSDDVDLANAQFTHGVTYDPVTGKLHVPVGVSEFSVLIPTVIDNIDDNLEDFTLQVGSQSSSGVIADVIITQDSDTVIAFHDFDSIDVGKRWKYLDSDVLNDANTEPGIQDGAEGIWGTDNKNDIIEVGREPIYRGKHADDKHNQVFELEARRGDNQFYTELNGAKEGQFFTLMFDVARRGHRHSPMAIFLVAADGSSNELLYTYDQSKEWTSENVYFQTPDDGDYRVVFESSHADSYGALLDNIKLETLNNVGYEDGYFPLNNIHVSLGSDALNLSDYKVKLLVDELPDDTIFRLGGDELTPDGNGYIDVSGYGGDLSNLSVNVSEPGNYTFDVVVLGEDNIELKSSPVDITVLPEGSGIQYGSVGDDILDAEPANDILYGLDGDDLFNWEISDIVDGGLDVIKDFKVGEDLLDLSDLLKPTETIEDLLSDVTAEVKDNDVTLTITRDGKSQLIQLENVADQLTGTLSEQLALLVVDPNL